jgi:hypothetical protein
MSLTKKITVELEFLEDDNQRDFDVLVDEVVRSLQQSAATITVRDQGIRVKVKSGNEIVVDRASESFSDTHKEVNHAQKEQLPEERPLDTNPATFTVGRPADNNPATLGEQSQDVRNDVNGREVPPTEVRRAEDTENGNEPSRKADVFDANPMDSTSQETVDERTAENKKEENIPDHKDILGERLPNTADFRPTGPVPTENETTDAVDGEGQGSTDPADKATRSDAVEKATGDAEATAEKAPEVQAGNMPAEGGNPGGDPVEAGTGTAPVLDDAETLEEKEQGEGEKNDTETTDETKS